MVITLRPREPSEDRVNSKSKEKQQIKNWLHGNIKATENEETEGQRVGIA